MLGDVQPRPQLAARRKALGYSQEALADLLQVRTQSVARWEQGTTTPLARYRRPLAETLELSLGELEQLIDGAGTGPVTVNGHAVPAWLDHYTSLEQAAARLETFEPIAIPGLLQTEEYATAVMRSSHLPVSEHTIRERVKARLARQAVLDREPDPLELVCVIDQSVFHRVTGGRPTMATQLDHLAHCANRPSIDIHVVPIESGAVHCASFGSFRLFTSKGASSPFITCTEDLTGFNYLDRRAAIDAHAQLFEHLTSVALTTSDSAALIETIAESYQ